MTTRELAPVTREPVRGVDFGRVGDPRDRVGGVTVVGGTPGSGKGRIVGRVGGGGSGLTKGEIQSLFDAQQRGIRERAAKAAAEQAERERIAAAQQARQEQQIQQQAQRQEKIESQKISGQLQDGGKPNQIGLPERIERDTPTVSFFGAAKKVGENIISKFIQSPDKPRVAFSEILRPFDFTVKPKASERVILSPGGQFFSAEKLSTTQIKLIESQGLGTPTTLGAEQLKIEQDRSTQIQGARADTQAGLQLRAAELQKDLDTGKINVTQAEDILGEEAIKAQEGLDQKALDIFKSTPDIPGVKAPRESPIRDVVAIAATTNPFTAAIAAASSFVSDPFKIKNIEDITSGKETIGAQATKVPSSETISFLVASGIGAGAKFVQVGKDITLGRISSAVSNLDKQVGAQIRQGKSIFEVGVSKGIGDAAVATQTAVARGLQIGKQGLKGVGTIKTEVIARDFLTNRGILIGTKSPFKFDATVLGKGTGKVIPSIAEVESGLAQRITILEGKKIPKIFGEFFTKPTQTTKELVGAVSTKVDDVILQQSGRIREAVVGGRDIALRFVGETKQATKIIPSPIRDAGVRIAKGPGISKATKPSQGLVPPIIDSASKVVSTVKIASNLPSRAIGETTKVIGAALVGIPRAVGGLGLTDLQIARGQGRGVFGITGVVRGKENINIKEIPAQFQPGRVTTDPFQEEGIKLTPAAVETTVPSFGNANRLAQPPITALEQPPITIQEVTPVGTTTARIPRGSSFGFGTGLPFGISGFDLPSLGGGIRKKPKKRGKKARKAPIRPSFTGIITGGIGLPAPSQGLGITPFTLRGLPSLIAPPKKKKKKKKKKK